MAMHNILLWALFPLLVTTKEIDLRRRCNEEDPLAWMCQFEEQGVYVSRILNGLMERIEFDRLTDSRLSLLNLPNLRMVTINEDLFDARQPCSLVSDMYDAVTVVLGQRAPTICPADKQSTRMIPHTTTDHSTVHTTEKDTTVSLSPSTEYTTSKLESKSTVPPTTQVLDDISTQDNNDDIIIIITITSSGAIVAIMIICMFCIMRKKRRARRGASALELGVRFHDLSRSSIIEGSEETIFDASSKRD